MTPQATPRQRPRPGAFADTGQLYGYGCPDCGHHNHTADGYTRHGIVTVECGRCGHVERFPRLYLAGGGETA